jgi:DNA replication protein DnaC
MYCPRCLVIEKYREANIQKQFYDFSIQDVEEKIEVEISDLKKKNKLVNFQELYHQYIKNIVDMYRLGRGMYLHGENETGKTTMAYLIAKYIVNETDYNVYCYNYSRLLEKYQKSWSSEDQKQFAVKTEIEHNFSEKDFIIIDDFLYQDKNSDWIREYIADLIEIRVEKNLPIIYTSNHSIFRAAENIDRSDHKQNAKSIVSKVTQTIAVIGKFKNQLLRLDNFSEVADKFFINK